MSITNCDFEHRILPSSFALIILKQHIHQTNAPRRVEFMREAAETQLGKKYIFFESMACSICFYFDHTMVLYVFAILAAKIVSNYPFDISFSFLDFC